MTDILQIVSKNKVILVGVWVCVSHGFEELTSVFWKTKIKTSCIGDI